MAHNLFGERFLGNREPAWHGLGQVFTDTPTLGEAFRRAGLGYDVRAMPVYYKNGSGEFVEIESRQAVVRLATDDRPQDDVLDITSDEFAFLGNERVAELFEPLAKLWNVETVGALGLGERIFFTLDAGEWSSHNDDLKLFFLVHDTKKAGETLRIVFTPVRVVCQNTLMTAEQSAVSSVGLAHRAGIALDVEFRTELITSMQVAQAQTLAQFDRMMDMPLSREQLDSVLLAAYPIPQPTASMVEAQRFAETYRGNDDLLAGLTDVMARGIDKMSIRADRFAQWTANIATRREAAAERLEAFNDEFPHLAATGWAVYNAVVETEDYRRGQKGAQEQAIFGDRAATKRAAYAAVFTV